MARGNYDSFESDTDAENEANKNAGWMRTKYWEVFYIFSILLLSFLVYIVTDENKLLSATIINVTHGVITFYSMHYRKGTELGGADDTLNDYDDLTFWQQLDGGYSWTWNKKVLMLMPLVIMFATLYVLLEIEDVEQFRKWLAPNVIVCCLITFPKVFGKSGKAE